MGDVRFFSAILVEFIHMKKHLYIKFIGEKKMSCCIKLIYPLFSLNYRSLSNKLLAYYSSSTNGRIPDDNDNDELVIYTKINERRFNYGQKWVIRAANHCKDCGKTLRTIGTFIRKFFFNFRLFNKIYIELCPSYLARLISFLKF